jgi:hypothetical protein
VQANDALRAFKLKEAERERQADLAIEAYAAKKAGLAAERARRESAAAAAKEARRKAMVRPRPFACAALVLRSRAQALLAHARQLPRTHVHSSFTCHRVQSKPSAALAERTGAFTHTA